MEEVGAIMAISETTRDGLRALTCDNGHIRFTLLPELGAKVISLVDLSSGREWISTQADVVFHRAALDDDYGAYDKSGWDECFPSIGAGFHPTAPWAGTVLADHGELWSRPWHCQVEAESIASSIYGVRFPYRFERRLTLEGHALHADYTVTNLVEIPFPCFWAMHPLFAAEPGMQVLLPAPTTCTCELSTLAPALGSYLERLDWPVARATDGRQVDLSTLRPPEEGFAIKLFTGRLTIGRAALYQPATGAWLGVSFDCAATPYLGIWLNQGGWPSRERGLNHVALEPAMARADQLDVAMRLDGIPALPPLGSRSWRVTLVVGEGGAIETFLKGDTP
jgi:galactose mutarotase-like enzyme